MDEKIVIKEWEAVQRAISYFINISNKYQLISYNLPNFPLEFGYMDSTRKRTYSDSKDLRYSNINDFYRENIQYPNEIVIALTECNCCIDHKKNRPVIFEKINDKSINDFIYPFKKKVCKCPCRHISRIICRSCTN